MSDRQPGSVDGGIESGYGHRITTSARYALAAARVGSLTKAAAECGVSQPALSAGLAALEQALGGRLFDRSPQGVTPTALGAALLPSLERLVEAARDLDLSAERERRGRRGRPLRVGVSSLAEPAVVGRLFDEVRRLDPGRALVLSEGDRAPLLEELRRGEQSLVVVPRVGDEPAVHRARLYAEPLVVVRDGGAATGAADRAEVRDLGDRPVVLVGEACGLTAVTRRRFADAGVPLTRYPGEARSYAMMQEWAALGLGTAIVPAGKLAEGVAASALVRDGAPLELDFDALWSDDDPDAELLGSVVAAIATPTR